MNLGYSRSQLRGGNEMPSEKRGRVPWDKPHFRTIYKN